jgi:hypothetical protein
MNNKSILDILEQIANACKILSQEVYSSLDYSNSTIDICANKFQELEFKIWELQEVYKNGDEKDNSQRS